MRPYSEYRTNGPVKRVAAVVVLRDGCELELKEVREHCLVQGLAVQKCPEQLEVVDALPRNAMGKVLKQDLRSRLTSPR